ncbi:hypothetical protein [Nitrosophilus labii]|uniref:hypothetical protein n=1 Tax=Nitrosophilus labii TaxID=2706014 RepID=UPI00165713D5|nr:hypothetical protein [Nitrosophilus labii]
MEINFDDLKKEFEDFKKTNCENECDENIEDEGFIQSVQKMMLAPVNCGVYFSRLDIKVIGLEFDEDVQIRERKRMLRDIMRAITSKKSLEKFFDIVKKHTDAKLSIYEELVQSFPASEKIFKDKFEKAEKFKKSLDKILKDFEGVEDIVI